MTFKNIHLKRLLVTLGLCFGAQQVQALPGFEITPFGAALGVSVVGGVGLIGASWRLWNAHQRSALEYKRSMLESEKIKPKQLLLARHPLRESAGPVGLARLLDPPSEPVGLAQLLHEPSEPDGLVRPQSWIELAEHQAVVTEVASLRAENKDLKRQLVYERKEKSWLRQQFQALREALGIAKQSVDDAQVDRAKLAAERCQLLEQCMQMEAIITQLREKLQQTEVAPLIDEGKMIVDEGKMIAARAVAELCEQKSYTKRLEHKLANCQLELYETKQELNKLQGKGWTAWATNLWRRADEG